jgi:GTP-binding protein
VAVEKSNFIDQIRIFCRSGNGGPGSAHFLRAKYNPRAGPDGGDGGRGGHVFLRGNKDLWTLLHLRWRKHIIAGNGERGGKNRSTGKRGADYTIEVPLGTIVRDEVTGRVEAEILEDGEQLLWMPGGRGGLGNTHFKSATHQAPDYAQPGERGVEGWKVLELKLLADVGLVGFPNAGKSTLLSAISAAKPAIADYPFTTLSPNLGMVPYRDDRSFCMADIPGIIEGAAEGKGLGHRFLRHIERNAVLLFLVPADSPDPRGTLDILYRELTEYNPELMDKRRLVAVSKRDLLGDEIPPDFSAHFTAEEDPLFFSSVTGQGLDALKDRIWDALGEPPDEG